MEITSNNEFDGFYSKSVMFPSKYLHEKKLSSTSSRGKTVFRISENFVSSKTGFQSFSVCTQAKNILYYIKIIMDENSTVEILIPSDEYVTLPWKEQKSQTKK